MNILRKSNLKNFPLVWANLDYFTESKANKKEIYLIETNNILDESIILFYSLFGELKDEINIYNLSWWDFCIDTWNIENDEYNYDLDTKSKETKIYLQMLIDSCIEKGYSGSCICLDWSRFLLTVLPCIITHMAPYSPIFYNIENDFFFYFHHTGSIGMYYQKSNDVINRIFHIANSMYIVK